MTKEKLKKELKKEVIRVMDRVIFYHAVFLAFIFFLLFLCNKYNW